MPREARVTGPQGTPLDLRAVEAELTKASVYYATDFEGQYLVSKAQLLLAHCRALRAALQEPVSEDEVTVMMQEYSNPRTTTLGDKIRRGLSRILGQRAAAVLAEVRDE